jgi:ABC-type antimicrobial peptide transport system permease subunit
MKTFGLSLLTALIGYVVGLFGGMALINLLSSNTHDRSVEAAMTGAFFIGPLLGVLGFVVAFVYLIARKRNTL